MSDRRLTCPIDDYTNDRLALVVFIATDETQDDARPIRVTEDEEDERTRHLASEVERLREQLQLSAEKAETQQEELKAATEVATLFLDRKLDVTLSPPCTRAHF